jgi:hypothetical protein
MPKQYTATLLLLLLLLLLPHVPATTMVQLLNIPTAE